MAAGFDFDAPTPATAPRRGGGSFRAARRSLSTLVALGLLAVAGCASAATEDPGPGPTRAAEFTACPTLRLEEIPEGFTAKRRELQALSDNHMGQVATYRDGNRSIQLFSGPDLYDTLEDLDLTAERVTTDDYEFTMSSTVLQPELLIAVMDEAGLKEPCDSVGVLTRHVDRGMMLEILGALVLRPGR